MAPDVDGKEVITIEGLSDGENLHSIQEKFMNEGIYQCGFCIPGMVMSVKALMDENPNAGIKDVKSALSGHICRCGTYNRITNAYAGGEINDK